MSNDFSALHYRPCAGIRLVNSVGRAAVGRRLDGAQSDDPAAWQTPQPGTDDGADSERAAFRELEEETGITPDVVQVIARSKDQYLYDLPDELLGRIWKGKYRGQRQSWFLMRFTG